jgi:hypothetical protein
MSLGKARCLRIFEYHRKCDITIGNAVDKKGESTMKHITVFAIAVCLLASLSSAGTASAQDHAARATVPFNFNVGDKWVPAGTYLMTSNMNLPEVIDIRSADGRILLLSVTQNDGRRLNTGKLVFTKYGDQYFLHEILCSPCGMNVAFPDSKHEKLARTRLAAGLLSPTDVYLALVH